MLQLRCFETRAAPNLTRTILSQQPESGSRAKKKTIQGELARRARHTDLKKGPQANFQSPKRGFITSSSLTDDVRFDKNALAALDSLQPDVQLAGGSDEECYGFRLELGRKAHMQFDSTTLASVVPRRRW